MFDWIFDVTDGIKNKGVSHREYLHSSSSDIGITVILLDDIFNPSCAHTESLEQGKFEQTNSHCSQSEKKLFVTSPWILSFLLLSQYCSNNVEHIQFTCQTPLNRA